MNAIAGENCMNARNRASVVRLTSPRSTACTRAALAMFSHTISCTA